jgi:hypothetical protein
VQIYEERKKYKKLQLKKDDDHEDFVSALDDDDVPDV